MARACFHRTLPVLGLLVTLATTSACEDEPFGPSINPFGATGITLSVGQVAYPTVSLREDVSDNVYVLVQNKQILYVEVSYGANTNENISIHFKPGFYSTQVTLKGLQASADWIPIMFYLRDNTDEFQTLKVKVTGTTYPDSGPPPETGPDSAVPDSAVPEGGGKDKGAKEAGSKDSKGPG